MTVMLAVNFIQLHGLNRCQFQSFLSEINGEYGDVLYHTEVQWLSCETVVKYFLVLRLEIKMFMNEKGKIVTELGAEKWLGYSALLCYIRHHLNYYTKLLG
jgi:hypothetical protein